MATRKISLVVPTRDRPHLLEVALRSLMAQTLPAEHFEVVVIEDGGHSASESVASGLFRVGGPVIRFQPIESGGVNAARNAAIAATTADVIVFTDDDVEAPPGWLAELVAGLERHPEADCAGGPVRIRYEGRCPRFCPEHSLGRGELDLGKEERRIDSFLLGANLAVRRRAFDRLGGFDETVLRGSGADWEWQYRLREEGGRIVYLPKAWIWHRRTADMLSRRRMLSERFMRSFRGVVYMRKHGSRGSLRTTLASLPGHFEHVARARCTHGWLSIASLLGRATGIVFDRLRLHPQTRHLD